MNSMFIVPNFWIQRYSSSCEKTTDLFSRNSKYEKNPAYIQTTSPSLMGVA